MTWTSPFPSSLPDTQWIEQYVRTYTYTSLEVGDLPGRHESVLLGMAGKVSTSISHFCTVSQELLMDEESERRLCRLSLTCAILVADLLGLRSSNASGSIEKAQNLGA